jgi:hypothetical protein
VCRGDGGRWRDKMGGDERDGKRSKADLNTAERWSRGKRAGAKVGGECEYNYLISLCWEQKKADRVVYLNLFVNSETGSRKK